jgi:mannose-6-phosphate isomerase-like protein (cupin superfamily)
MNTATQLRRTDKFDHEHLETFEGVIPGDGPGRLSSAAGELVRFANGGSYQFAVYWDCHPGGPCRGNHYHLDKTEVMYIISGKLQAAYYDLDIDERIDVELVAGDLVRVRPRLVHSYIALGPTQVVEVATHAYSHSDTYRHVLL